MFNFKKIGKYYSCKTIMGFVFSILIMYIILIAICKFFGFFILDNELFLHLIFFLFFLIIFLIKNANIKTISFNIFVFSIILFIIYNLSVVLLHYSPLLDHNALFLVTTNFDSFYKFYFDIVFLPVLFSVFLVFLSQRVNNKNYDK